MSDASLRSGNSFCDPAGKCNMVVFDEHTVIEAHAVVLPAADRDRILFEHPQPGRRLTRIHYRRFCSINGIDVLTRQSRYTRHSLDEVKCGALTHKQYVRKPFQRCK